MKALRVTVGQYFPAESPIHHLDPRVKICLTMLLMVAIFMVKSFTGFAALGLLLCLVVYVGQLPWSWILRGLKPLRYILLFTLVMHLLFTPGLVILLLGPLRITQEGLRNGLFFCARLVLLVSGTSLLTFTTTPIELTDGIEYLLSPFRRFKVPAHELAMMMTIALRFIPTLLVETEKIMKAQMARGADFESGNIFRRAKSLVPLLVPLFVSVFRRADELALAMESRCYRGGEGRTRMRALRMEGKDWLMGMATVVLLVLAILVGRF